MTDFEKTKSRFHLPKGLIYLDGNSLGPLPKKAKEAVSDRMQNEWGEMLIRGWNAAGWMAQPMELGNRLGALLGAKTGTIAVGDTLSIRVYQALASAIDLAARKHPERRVILSDNGNFPTDLYMAEGLLHTIGKGYELKIVAPEDVETALDETIAVLMLTEVDYRTGRLHSMKHLTEKAHCVGALTVWDLAHSAGAIEVDLTSAGADFAAGCTYKYFNAGPGAPAFIYVTPDHLNDVRPALSGWLGHEQPFAFDLEYRPGSGIDRMRVGTPSVLQMEALSVALDIWDDVDMADVRKRSMELTSLFAELVTDALPELDLASPTNARERGSQISFKYENGYAVVQALIARGVVGDFRAPDIMRFGVAPLYNDEEDIRAAAQHLIDIIKTKEWDQPQFLVKSAVT